MSKPSPAYPFYGSDFDADTSDMTNEEVGVYVRLMNYQWKHGNVPSDLTRLALVVRTTPQRMAKLWEAVGRKFREDGSGTFQNSRMEKVREERLAYIERMRQLSASGVAARQQGLPYDEPDGEPHGQPPGPPSPDEPCGTPLLSPSPDSVSDPDPDPDLAPPPFGRRSASVLGDRHRAQQAKLRAEIEWRVEQTWADHLKARQRFWQAVNGEAQTQPPTLTSEIQAAIREALKAHDGERLGAEDRERWRRESPVRAAGVGLFLSPWHTGTDPRNQNGSSGGSRYLEPWRPWKHQRGKPDPVPTFSQLYFEERSHARRR